MRRFWLMALLLVTPFFLTGCSLKSRPKVGLLVSPSSTIGPGQTIDTTSVTYLTVEPTSLDAAFTADFALAKQKVEAWQTNAELSYLSIKLPANLALDAATEVFVYGSANDAYNWWTFNISQNTAKAVRAIIPKEDYLGTIVQPIPMQFWKINYVQALQLAEVNGGADWRLTHPDATVTINLAVGQPKNYLWWSVEYESTTSQPYKILINAATKEVVNPTSG